MGKRATQALTATAYHEAGHAVACYILHRGFRYVTIRPDRECLGRVMQTPLPDSFWIADLGIDTRARRIAEREIIIDFAGEAAGAIWRGRHNWRSSRADFQSVTELTGRVCNTPDEEEAFARWLAIRARDMIACPMNWEQVKAVAKALLDKQHLSSRQVRQIIRRQVGQIIRSHVAQLQHKQPASQRIDRHG